MEMLTVSKRVQGVMFSVPRPQGSSQLPELRVPEAEAGLLQGVFLKLLSQDKKFQISVCFLLQTKGFAFSMKYLLPRGIL